MRKSLIIALVAFAVSVIAPAAQADPTLGERIIAQEKTTAEYRALGPVPQNMTAAEYRALRLRSEALNQKYGLGPAPQGMTAAAYRALRLRSEALNQKYGLGPHRTVPQGTTKQVDAQPATQTAIEQIVAQERGRQRDAGLFGPSHAPVLVAGPPDRFDLRDAGIGGAATLSLVLLVGAAFAFRAGLRHAIQAAAGS